MTLLRVLLAGTLVGAAPGQDESAVRAALSRYIDALNALDAEGMAACFTEDATAFVPSAQAERVEGRPALLSIFRGFVARSGAAAPRQPVVAQDLRVDVSGDLALATFEVRRQASLNRRSFVLRRSSSGWLISHFHASDFVLSATAPAPGKKPAAEDVVQTIGRLEDELNLALVRYDAEALRRLWDDDLAFVFPNGALATKSDRLADLKGPPPNMPTSTNESVDVKIYGDVAVALVVSKWTGTMKQDPFSARFRATHIWAKRGGEWRMIFGHVSQIKE
jgi:uncharacterized protein (TIGR02246 family)